MDNLQKRLEVFYMCEYCNHVDKKQLKKNAKAQALLEYQKLMAQIAEDDKKWLVEWKEKIVNSFDLPPRQKQRRIHE